MTDQLNDSEIAAIDRLSMAIEHLARAIESHTRVNNMAQVCDHQWYRVAERPGVRFCSKCDAEERV